MPLTGFEPAIPVSERQQTHAVVRAVTEIGPGMSIQKKILTRIATESFLTGRLIDCVMNMPNTLRPQKKVP